LHNDVDDLDKTRLQDAHDQALIDYENIIREQKRKILLLHQQVDTLNITLSELYASEGWKLLSLFYKFRNWLLPIGSPRHKMIKKWVNRLRGKKEGDIGITDFTAPGGNRYLRTLPTQFDPFRFPRFVHPKVSIIVPAYNGWEMNYLCLKSIWEHTDGITYEVIFADDVSTDDTQHIGRYIKNIVHIRGEENRGFLRNCNHAASFARGEYLHFLNNDTEVTDGWLTSLVDLMERDPSVGMAGSKLIYPDGRLQEAGGIIWQDASGWNYGHKGDPEASEFNYLKEVDYISGASILVRKSLWERLGGFDELYLPAYCEDSDLAFAIRREGFKVVYQPLSKVVHFEGFSHGTDAGAANGAGLSSAVAPNGAAPSNGAATPNGAAPSIKSYQKINARKFAEKWQPVLQHQFPNGVHSYWTRDRSRDKPTIVVIDHYVPHFDKDAGSRTTFQYLELFVELGMNVKFIGDNFYRQEPYTTVLQQKGIEVLYGDYYKDNWLAWLKERDQYIDFIFLNRPHVSIKYIRQINDHLRAKIFYYTHDLHFYRELMEYEVTGDPLTLKSSREWKKTEYKLFADSDVILTPSRKEKEIIQRDFPGKPVEVMPAFFYPVIPDPILNFQDRKDLLFVGGFNHGPNVDAVCWFAGEVLPLIWRENPDIRLIVVGSNMPGRILELDSPGIVIRGFVTDEELDLLYGQVRLSVIPLRFGAGLKGKTVEALAKGLPVVSTSFGTEGLEGIEAIVRPADTAEAFAKAVTDVYSDVTKLGEISEAAVAYARTHFTKTSAAAFFKTLFGL
jgi:GT2 family glycosyltransferase/glycosyltransferase involved in cell wall biosynthesis